METSLIGSTLMIFSPFLSMVLLKHPHLGILIFVMLGLHIWKLRSPLYLRQFINQQGEKEKEKQKLSGDEACHLVDLTKDDDTEKDPEAGPSGSEQQALPIVPITAVPMAQGESTQHEALGSGGGNYSKAEQIDALSNLEEGEIESDKDWDVDDEDVLVEFLKGDGKGVYELENGEIFDAPTFEVAFTTGSVEPENVAEASGAATSIEAFPTDP
ncbi:hypothetical protein L1987_57922 [Smallanthus sonchifolius]|uniref:Uncharacterized protein n=1 Tax=Smallanthus sonchifolius TaxID=185202 RepID=A0ACB9DDW9_9ASTR|nr:hypothetical protein L1987_57922 [Smallanthus sonchifolius]